MQLGGLVADEVPQVVEPPLGIVRCPLVQLALDVEYPLPRLFEAQGWSAGVHRRPPPIPTCRVFAAALPHAAGSPGLGEYYGGSATPRRQQRTVRLPRPRRNEGPAGTAGALPTFTIHRSAGSASSYTPVASPPGNRYTPHGLARPIS